MTNDISHPVLDAFHELGHKARVAATSAYVALPVLMASAPAYGHETGQPHEHTTPFQHGVTFVVGVGLGLLAEKIIRHGKQSKAHSYRLAAYASECAILGGTIALYVHFRQEH